MGLRAGLLSDKITIQRAQTVKDDFGGTKTVWQDLYTTRTRKTYRSGNRVNENNEIIFAYTKTFTVRRYVPVQERDRVLWNGQKWRILSLEPSRDKQSIEIVTELINE